jgi:hypothetical protein
LKSEGKNHHLKIGEELLIPAGVRHTARNGGKTVSKMAVRI